MVNKLIKRKNLVEFLNKKGIKRINKEAMGDIDKEIIEHLETIAEKMKSNMIISGRKTLIREDVINI